MSVNHKEDFLSKLLDFKTARGEDLDPPTFAKRPVDQFKLWTAVQESGGHAEVTASKGWARIGRLFDPPKTMTDLSFRIKKIYETNILPFEKAVLDGTVTDMYIPPRTVQAATPSAPKVRQAKPLKRSSGGGQAGGAKRAKQENTNEMVGKRIRVLWPDERQFFSGTVTSFNPSTGMHKIDYDDGDEEQLDLNTQTWHLLTDFSMDGDANELQLFDNGGLGQLHSAAEALANGMSQGARGVDSQGQAQAELQSPDADGCVLQGQGYKVYETQDQAGFEVFCLTPGLQLDEIRVQCWDSGKLMVTRNPKESQSSTKWGLRPLKHKIRLPRSVHARSARALVTLHGQLYIKVYCEAPPGFATEEPKTAEAQAAEQPAAADQGDPEPARQPTAEAAGPALPPEAAAPGPSQQQDSAPAAEPAALQAPPSSAPEASAGQPESGSFADTAPAVSEALRPAESPAEEAPEALPGAS